jgi:phage terminase large subunit-like protein
MPSRTQSRGPSITRFAARYVRIPSGRGAGKPFVFEPWQTSFTNYFHLCRPDGSRIFKLGVLGIPRGNGKSPMAAMYGLYETLARTDAPEIYCIAENKAQAQVVHKYARAYVENGPLQKHGVRSGRDKIAYEKGHAFFECLPASGTGVHGRNPAALIADEPHAYTTSVQVETLDGMLTALHKRDNSYANLISTAGDNPTTMFAETYYNGLALPVAPIKHTNPCLRIHEDRENGILFWWYGIPEDRAGEWDNPELWRAANPASWLDVDDLKQQLAILKGREHKFQQLHCNMWVQSSELWLPVGVWDSLKQPGIEFPRRCPIWVGVDIGWNDDSSAVVWATRLEDDRILIRAKIWTTRDDQVGEYVPGGTMKLELVEKFILEELKPKHKIREIAYDPIYFGRSAEILERRGCRMVEMPPMHPTTVAAWEEFKQHVFDGTIVHDGDPNLTRHVASAGVQQTASGPRVRKTVSGKIDALAAAVLAVSRCDVKTRPSAKKPNVFWMNLDGDDPKPDSDSVASD